MPRTASPPGSRPRPGDGRHHSGRTWARVVAVTGAVRRSSWRGEQPPLIPDATGSFRFERKALRSGVTTTTSGTVSGSSGSDGSCSGRTHRCVAVVVTTARDIHGRCHTTRAIHRYRYVATKPPAGTTGPDTQPTAPIVGRTNRLVMHPGKLTLVLRGAPRRRVVVLLPGPARSFQSCDIGALATSHQASSVVVIVARS
jgi:hypothetical protein